MKIKAMPEWSWKFPKTAAAPVSVYRPSIQTHHFPLPECVVFLVIYIFFFHWTHRLWQVRQVTVIILCVFIHSWCTFRVEILTDVSFSIVVILIYLVVFEEKDFFSSV